MPVFAYVSSDSAGRPWSPDNSHETLSAIELIKSLWVAFNHEAATYCVVSNLHHPNADLVILTETGIGVVELKHYAGRIREGAPDTWFAGAVPIKAGRYTNPHLQVQAYGTEIRRLITPRLTSWWHSPPEQRWQAYKMQTSVCFTNRDAVIDTASRDLERREQQNRHSWEEFLFLTPALFPAWVAALKFGVDQGYTHRFEPYRLTPSQVVEVATTVLGGTPWTQISKVMPTGHPYAYLTMIENGLPVQTYNLINEEHLVGREAEDLRVPARFERVSRKHARISRILNDVYIEDVGSSKGTFINGTRVSGQQLLLPNQQITLGGMATEEKVCLLTFSRSPIAAAATYMTDSIPDSSS